MKKPIIVLILFFSLFIVFSGCKNSKERNETPGKENGETPDKDWKIKNSKLLLSHRHDGNRYTIYESDDLAFLNELSQEEIDEYIEYVNYSHYVSSYNRRLADLGFLERLSHIKGLYIYLRELVNI
jgi:hypothetical protein